MQVPHRVNKPVQAYQENGNHQVDENIFDDFNSSFKIDRSFHIPPELHRYGSTEQHNLH